MYQEDFGTGDIGGKCDFWMVSSSNLSIINGYDVSFSQFMFQGNGFRLPIDRLKCLKLKLTDGFNRKGAVKLMS